MKKILVVGALIVSAMVSNAALVDWKVTGAAIDDGSSVYIVLGGTPATSFASVAAIQAIAVSGASQGTVARKSGKYTLAGTLNNDSFTTSANQMYYVFVSSDAKSYAVTSAYTVDTSKIYTAGNPSPGTWSATVANSYTSFGGGPEPTPEPTSGLLLLLGVAGLALKRKNA